MTNDSSTGGYLAPLESLVDDAELDLLFQPVIVGVTGLAGSLVRRKGQAVPGPQPDRNTTWCSFAAMTTDADTNPNIVHDGNALDGEGVDYGLRSETIEVTVTFYGPSAVGTAKILRDGLGIPQNRDQMRCDGLAYVGLERITFVPDLENGQVVRRADVVFRARRMAVRTYPVRNITSASGTVTTDSQSRSGRSVVTSTYQTET
ncbi:MAG: hypothetical protein P4M05_28400 [Bradyrhizobium sp.]|nr:hypothetical protein [Bradyrhizobium sp.]